MSCRSGLLREGEGEVEALPQALEGQERVWREVPRRHLAVRLLVGARRTLALEASDQQVDAGAAVPADVGGAASRPGGQLAALTWAERGREMEINTSGDALGKRPSERRSENGDSMTISQRNI